MSSSNRDIAVILGSLPVQATGEIMAPAAFHVTRRH